MPTYDLTTIDVQSDRQEVFEVYADESKAQTLGFVYDEANARLLADAPEMLEALDWIADYVAEHPDFYPDENPDGDHSEGEWAANVRAILAKVKP